MLLVGGENLIDFIQQDVPSGLPQYQANPGGSPYNCAMAAARQGADVTYMTPVSSDTLGDLLAARLVGDGVTLGMARSDAPSSLAVVSLVEGAATYQFYRENTAERQVTLERLLDAVPGDVSALFLGSLAITDGADAEAWADFFLAMKKRGVFCAIDPNIRAPFIRDRAAYLDRLQRLLAAADLIKLSDEDLAWLAPGEDVRTAADALFERTGTGLLVVTLGAEGAFAMNARADASVVAAPVRDLADTVGAGDTFMATLLASLGVAGGAQPDLSALDGDGISALLKSASTAAALNCEQSGCVPPSLEMVQARLAALSGG